MQVVHGLVVEEAILGMVADQPSSITRAVARQLHVPHSTTWRVLKDERLRPYHVQRFQELTQRDCPLRVEFARWFLQQSAVNPDFGETAHLTPTINMYGRMYIHLPLIQMFIRDAFLLMFWQE
ncbi:hypothetical protein AVEN_168572-1 [Araneus ventricosus]|uniref:Uncharacterized protein n=1 Tax=Araneus ventricosus TaxID=182803 RepID=A0A4Y2LQM6_ARAVE|nr:hypothetical protein AVEN_168572-1 [Araneus ventricosus]